MDSNGFQFYAIIYLFTKIKDIFNQLVPIFKLILMYIFNYRLYNLCKTENKNKLNCFLEKEKFWCFKYNSEGKPHGLVIHKSLFPKFYANTDNYEYDAYIFCRKETFDNVNNLFDKQKFVKIDLEKIEKEEQLKKLTKNNDDNDEDDDDNDDDNKILYLKKTFTEYCGNNNYQCRDIKISNNHYFNDIQDELFKEIMEFYNENKFCKIFISGAVNTGKSYFSYILARKLKCYLCDSFNPTEPADNLSNLYTSKFLSGDKPLVLLIDEVDIIIKNIHEQKIVPHKHYPISVKDKMSWNSFLDKIDYGLYPNLILIFTSNLDRNQINKLDNSYLRDGRINIYKKF